MQIDSEKENAHGSYETSQASISRLALGLAVGAGAVLLVSGTFLLVAPGQAQATPAYAQETGKALRLSAM